MVVCTIKHITFRYWIHSIKCTVDCIFRPMLHDMFSFSTQQIKKIYSQVSLDFILLPKEVVCIFSVNIALKSINNENLKVYPVGC